MFEFLLGHRLLVPIALSVVLYILNMLFFKKKWSPNGLVSFDGALWSSEPIITSQHCYVTGGTQGLGQELAIELARRGAHVSVVARTQSKIDETLQKLAVSLTSLFVHWSLT